MSKPQMYRVRKGENEMLVSEFTLNKRALKEGYVVIAEVFYRGDGSTDEVPTPGHEKTVNDASKIGFVPEEIANLRAKKAEAETKGAEDLDPNKLPPIAVELTSADIDPNKVEGKATEPVKGTEPTTTEAKSKRPKNN